MKIDFKLEGNRMEYLEVEGSNIELAAGVGYLAGMLYSATWKLNPEAAKALKWAIMAAMSPDSPTWDPKQDVQGIFITQEVTE